MRLSRVLYCVLLSVFAAGTAAADDVWVVRGFAAVPQCPFGEPVVEWRADALFYNTADREAVLHLESVSNGGNHRDDEFSFAIPPGEVRGLAGTANDFANAILWVTRLTVPADVTVEGRLEFFHESCRSTGPQGRAAARLALPVFRSLVPAGVRTLHAGTDLGIQNVRTNVSVYNAGSVTATATIEVHRAGCATTLPPVTRVVSIPPDTLIQTPVYEAPSQCSDDISVPRWVAYTVVTVDQPSLSFVVSLSNEAGPSVTIGFAGAR
jgi:hypothetical protein